MSDRETGEELYFHPDFAERVLGDAGIVARRKRMWRNAGAGSVVLLMAVLAVSWNALRSPVSPAAPAPSVLASNDGGFAAASDETDPLQYMFPDAKPLARFSNRYTNASSGGAMQRQNLLFADDTDTAADDGS